MKVLSDEMFKYEKMNQTTVTNYDAELKVLLANGILKINS
jgi:hypothetical protein